MKKIILIVCMTAAAAAVFASGAQEVNEEGVVELERAELERNSYLAELEQIEVKGTIDFESPVPELVTASGSYTLFAPGAKYFYDYVSEGDSVGVKGYIVDEDSMPGPGGRGAGGINRGAPMRKLDALEGNTIIMVESVEIDGTVYQLPWADDAGRFADCDSCGGFRDSRQGGKFGGRQRSF